MRLGNNARNGRAQSGGGELSYCAGAQSAESGRSEGGKHVGVRAKQEKVENSTGNFSAQNSS